MASERLQFHELGLDDRLLKAVEDLGWSQPTLIQEKAIPLALEGKDLLARARTGSGKTAAYAVPVIQRILASKQSVREQDVRALILVPTKELGQQVQTMMRQLSAYCSRDVRVADISSKADLSAQSHLPKIYQSFLMSATFTEDVQALKELLLHNPVILKLQGSQLPDSSQLQQYSIKCEEEDKFLLIYALLKLRLVQGKTLLFVGAVDRCYRLKLFLEQFGIPACVLNSELPVQSRSHIIAQFNQGFYDYIIATDEESLADPTAVPQTPVATGRRKTAEKGKTKDKEYGVSRGVDFQNVANVINFDFPTTVESYIHRVGRTARADNPGTALSFVSHTELSLFSEVEEALRGDDADSVLKPYQFKMEEIQGFRYRCRDAMRSVTKQAVREARLKEIKQELLNSEKLKTYFEDNPRDLQLLRHDKDLHPAVVKPHLKNVPEYLISETLRSVVNPLSGSRRRRKRKTEAKAGVLKSSFKKNIHGKNPLKSFRYIRGRNRKGKAGR
ncbi:probable ATP-dependent RNA helicase DDX56 isoform X2 [Channa argus]|uniref:probable ATP-dependent RNA helicase DDX56 isoform X2 n=1 Tax=Channa argus TaxID=215402 RepID=UPI0035211909